MQLSVIYYHVDFLNKKYNVDLYQLCCLMFHMMTFCIVALFNKLLQIINCVRRVLIIPSR